MTAVTLVRGKNGIFRSCRAFGHADFAVGGFDIVCAAVTAVLKTAMQVLFKTEGVTMISDTSSRGNLAFSVEVQKTTPVVESRLVCIADFIAEGIRSTAAAYPDNVLLREQKEL